MAGVGTGRNVTGHRDDRAMLLSIRCPVCRRAEGAPCIECRELFSPVGPVPPPTGVDALFAATSYTDAARPLVAALKYRNQRAVTSWLASAMVAVLPPDEHPVVVTWAPTSPARRRERGFDQAELLARAVARRIGVAPRRLLVRRSGGPQTGRGAAERHADVTRFLPTRRPAPPSVLLVDDVVTTGATMRSAAGALHVGGARRVVGLVAAATPPPGGPSR